MVGRAVAPALVVANIEAKRGTAHAALLPPEIIIHLEDLQHLGIERVRLTHSGPICKGEAGQP